MNDDNMGAYAHPHTLCVTLADLEIAKGVLPDPRTCELGEVLVTHPRDTGVCSLVLDPPRLIPFKVLAFRRLAGLTEEGEPTWGWVYEGLVVI